MNGAEFFVQHFGRFFYPPTDNPIVDAQRVLHSNHPIKGGAPGRLTTGNVAIIKTSGAILRGRLDVPGIAMTDANSNELIVDLLSNWSGEPVLIVAFDKVLFPPANLLVTYDPRRARICRAKAVGEVNFARVRDLNVDKDLLNKEEQMLRGTLKRLAKEESKNAA